MFYNLNILNVVVDMFYQFHLKVTKNINIMHRYPHCLLSYLNLWIMQYNINYIRVYVAIMRALEVWVLFVYL